MRSLEKKGSKPRDPYLGGYLPQGLLSLMWNQSVNYFYPIAVAQEKNDLVCNNDSKVLAHITPFQVQKSQFVS
ncbi:MAG: hypothetical protein HYZ16_02040 [Bacteroidetes bacterium]|jgi:hypothetical protein|nr:hypothetical protein [Bacteroidota bacterium]